MEMNPVIRAMEFLDLVSKTLSSKFLSATLLAAWLVVLNDHNAIFFC
jgi:hypothetical protein